MDALMRHYHNHIPEDIDEYIKLECEIKYLSSVGVIPVKFE